MKKQEIKQQVTELDYNSDYNRMMFTKKELREIKEQEDREWQQHVAALKKEAEEAEKYYYEQEAERTIRYEERQHEEEIYSQYKNDLWCSCDDEEEYDNKILTFEEWYKQEYNPNKF